MRAVMIALVCLLAGPALAEKSSASQREADIYPILKMPPGTAYVVLRVKAMTNGFKPVANKNRYQRCTDALRSYCDRYPEALACLGDGEADCRFLLSYAESWFIVKAVGAPGELTITEVVWLDPEERRDTEKVMKWRY